jgi:hypothetical protein
MESQQRCSWNATLASWSRERLKNADTSPNATRDYGGRSLGVGK